jgi:hypothetical protein
MVRRRVVTRHGDSRTAGCPRPRSSLQLATRTESPGTGRSRTTGHHRSESCRHSSAVGSRNRYTGRCRSTANTASSTTSRRSSVSIPRQSGPRLVMTRYGGPGTGSAAISASSASAPVVSSPSNCAVRPRSRRSASRGRLRRSPSVTGRRSTADATAAPASTTPATVSRCSASTCWCTCCTYATAGVRGSKTCRPDSVVCTALQPTTGRVSWTAQSRNDR